MQDIPSEHVIRRLGVENPWWRAPHQIDASYAAFAPREYLRPFYALVARSEVRRAVVLLGPRRVGKTVLVHQAIRKLLASGVPPTHVAYFTIDHPLYNGRSLEELLELAGTATGVNYMREPCYAFFDEVQYLRNWEVHLKALVDERTNLRLVASGSAAAALRLKSHESGAGRFTEFLLPPLTFHEYLSLLDKPAPARQSGDKAHAWTIEDIEGLNRDFLHYLNFGGYPEAIFSPAMQADPGRFIKNDIIDKVLLRDLPGLYGISDIQELNLLFTTLAFNTAGEISLEQLAQKSGVAKNTIKRYVEYLEAAFLIKVVHRVDRNARRFQRANFFKVYLTNPSIRSALFAPLTENDDQVGGLAETGAFAQWFHRESLAGLHYARWNQGEVDIVGVDAQQRPRWAVEVKWSDRQVERPEELAAVLTFCRNNGLHEAVVTTRSVTEERQMNDVRIIFVPVAIYCYAVGANILVRRTGGPMLPLEPDAFAARGRT